MSTLANSDLFIVQRPAGGDAGTYNINWESILDNIAASPAVQFKGTANFTSAGDDPAPADNGDLYANTTAGTFAWANPEEASKAVEVGDYCIWDADDGVWRFIGNVGGGGGAVESVDATFPLTMNGGATEGDVVVESTEATTTTAGHVARLATADDVDGDNDSPPTDAVVTADLLRATNAALDAATAGGVSDVTGGIPAADDIPNFWETDEAAAKYATNPIGVTDRSGNVKEVYAMFASESQAGVNYLAPAGTGAVIDFDNDDEDDPTSLDNIGAMTIRRTFVNFVPRDFEALNSLP